MERGKQNKATTAEWKPDDVQFLKVYRHLIKYGGNFAMFMSNLIDWYNYFQTHGKLVEGMFFQTHQQQATRTGLSDHQIRQSKQLAIVNRMMVTRLKGSPAREWYELNLEHIDIQLAIEILKVKPLKNSNTSPLKIQPLITRLNNETNKTSSSVEVDIFFDSNNKITPSMFEEFWKAYPRKENKGKALTAWNKLCAKPLRPTWEEIRNAIHHQKNSPLWQVARFIAHPTTWLHNSYWLNDPKLMVIYDDKETPSPGQKRADGAVWERDSKDGKWYWTRHYDGIAYRLNPEDGIFRHRNGEAWSD